MSTNSITQQTLDDDKPLIYVPPKKRTIFFLILYGLFIIDFISRVGINAIFPVIQEDLNLTDTQVGMMGSIVLFGMAVFVLPISFLGEKFSPKKTVNILSLIWTVGTLLSGIANNFSTLIAARFFVGTGNSAYAPLSNSLITNMYPKSRWGKQVGLYNTAMTVGGALGAIVFANIAANLGWRMAFYACGIVSLLLAIASFSLPDAKKLLAEQHKHQNTSDSNEPKVRVNDALKVICKNSSLLYVCAGAAIVAMVMQAMNSWLSIYFVRELDYSVEFAATLVAVMGIIGTIGFPIGGAIMDKWYKKDKRGRVFLPCVCIFFATILYIVGIRLGMVISIFIGSFLLTMASTSFHVATQELVPAWYKSVSYGVYVLSIQLFGAIGPLLAGSLSEIMGLVPALTILLAITFLAIIVLFLASRGYIRNFDNARALEAKSDY